MEIATLSLNVLIVENHVETRQSLEIFLSVLGHRSDGVEGVASAIALASRTRYDVLLSDLRLPDGDGWDLPGQLDARGCRPAHAIAMSGMGSPSDHVRSRDAGFALLLVKPFAPEALAAALGRAQPLHVSSPAIPGRGETLPTIDWAQRLHDNLCQQLAAAALWQGILIRRLKAMPPSESLGEAEQVSRLLDDALTEARALMREMREGDKPTLGL